MSISEKDRESRQNHKKLSSCSLKRDSKIYNLTDRIVSNTKPQSFHCTFEEYALASRSYLLQFAFSERKLQPNGYNSQQYYKTPKVFTVLTFEAYALAFRFYFLPFVFSERKLQPLVLTDMIVSNTTNTTKSTLHLPLTHIRSFVSTFCSSCSLKGDSNL